MATAADSTPLKLFTKLGPRVLLYEPPAVNGADSGRPTGDKTAPDMIVFLAWMLARPRHVEKYMAVHRKTYPSSKILLINTTDVDFLFSSEAKRRSQIEVAVSAILALDASSSSGRPPRLLVHSFSNGGGKRFWGLVELYKERSPTHARLPMTAVVFDSSPGFPQFWRTVHVLMQAAPNNFLLRFLFGCWVYSLSAWISFYVNYTTLFRDLVHNPMKGLNDPAIMNLKAPRCYIYSEEDEAIDAGDVERHAAIAEKIGFPVTTFPVKGTGHVQHVLKHDKVYWEMVWKTWELGVKLNA